MLSARKAAETGNQKTEPLVFAGVCDWAGIVRGKAFPEADIGARLRKGVG